MINICLEEFHVLNMVVNPKSLLVSKLAGIKLRYHSYNIVNGYC